MTSQRGFTLSELAVTMVVASVLAFPIIYIMREIAAADQRVMDRIEAVRELRLVAENLRMLARDASARITDLNQQVFEIAESNTRLNIYHLSGFTTIQRMATIKYDEANQELRLLDDRTNLERVIATNVASARFDLGPALDTTGANLYGKYAVGLNPRSFVLDIEVENGRIAHAQRMLIHAPNAR